MTPRSAGVGRRAEASYFAPANNASSRAADSSCMPGRACEYVSIVSVIDACPSISCTTLRRHFAHG